MVFVTKQTILLVNLKGSSLKTLKKQEQLNHFTSWKKVSFCNSCPLSESFVQAYTLLHCTLAFTCMPQNSRLSKLCVFKKRFTLLLIAGKGRGRGCALNECQSFKTNLFWVPINWSWEASRPFTLPIFLNFSSTHILCDGISLLPRFNTCT